MRLSRIGKNKLKNVMSKAKTKSATVEKLAYSRTEAAAMLGVHPITISRLTERGELHPNIRTRRPLYSREDLIRWRDMASPRPV